MLFCQLCFVYKMPNMGFYLIKFGVDVIKIFFDYVC